MDEAAVFESERPRLLRIADSVLDDAAEAEDVVQAAWLRLHRTDADIVNLAGWLTTVTTRLCLDRLRARIPEPVDADRAPYVAPGAGGPPDPLEDVILADAVGIALHVVLDRLTPPERVAFVLHDSFGIDFSTIAEILGRSPGAARKLASRARGKVAQPSTPDGPADWVVVDAFMAAAREGDFARLIDLLAPDAVVSGDAAAVAAGTPARIDGARGIAEMFNGAARAALPVFLNDRPGAAWFHRGEPRVLFDFTVGQGIIRRIDFRAEPGVLAGLRRRQGGRALGSS